MILVFLLGWGSFSEAAAPKDELQTAVDLYRQGQYFKAARFAFSATDGNPRIQASAYSWIALSLMKSGLHHSATYFFIRTLQVGTPVEIRRVLTGTEELLFAVGPDLLRKYLVRHTKAQDYDLKNLSAFYYAQGKDAILRGDLKRATALLGDVASGSSLYPYALQLLATAYALSGRTAEALRAYERCEAKAGSLLSGLDSPRTYHSDGWIKQRRADSEDLTARCIAGRARVLYEQGQFEESDRAYDLIAKDTFVWTDILFEAGWASFAMKNYNRTLGRLVSYKSPGLEFVFNPEVDVLRAQTYMMLCLYDDANGAINDFNAQYANVGIRIKKYVEGNQHDPLAFYESGKRALSDRLHSDNPFHRVLNRFVRSPYFQGLVQSERDLGSERARIRQFDSFHKGVSHAQNEGFPGFLNVVLNWRRKTIRLLGGFFVKNSLLDYHGKILSDFDKMSYIKLEMLSRSKERLAFNRTPLAERGRGNVHPQRRDHQYYWSFNGEFWNDEIGDYVFGLESACGSKNGV